MMKAFVMAKREFVFMDDDYPFYGLSPFEGDKFFALLFRETSTRYHPKVRRNYFKKNTLPKFRLNRITFLDDFFNQCLIFL